MQHTSLTPWRRPEAAHGDRCDVSLAVEQDGIELPAEPASAPCGGGGFGARARRKRINLALQGGGAAGGFTGGSKRSQQRLAELWRAASFGGNLPEPQRAVVERLFSFLPPPAMPSIPWLGALSPLWSPYDLNPLNINPLKELIERCRFRAIARRAKPRALRIGHQRAHRRARVFGGHGSAAEVVMASAGLPLLSRAVESDGDCYRDAGYGSNPALLPFIRTTAEDSLSCRFIRARARIAGERERDHEPRQRDHVQRLAAR